MSNLDLQEATRRDDTFTMTQQAVDLISEIPVGLALIWVWCWDVIRNWYENEQWADVHEDEYVNECFPPEVTLKQIWDKFWEQSDTNGFSLEFGVEQLDEHLRDWLREENFIVALDDDRWLDD